MLSIAAMSANTFPSREQEERFSQQLKQIYRHIKQQYPFVACIELALRQPGSDALHLHAASCPNALGHLTDSCSSATTSGNETQVIDMGRLLQQCAPRNPARYQFKSGLRLPVVVNEHLHGFTLFSATEDAVFTPSVIEQMRIYTRVIAELVNSKQAVEKNLRHAVNAILKLNHVDEAESPAHLKRVAHYSAMIARHVAKKRELSAEWIDHLYLYAPLHDIGKAFMPEALLNKPGRFTPEEYERMKTHTLKGREIIEHMIDVFGLQPQKHHTQMLKNIVTHHHETIDGLGYPLGLKGDEIPLEARIVAVADVLDALLAKRVYKQAWSLEKTLETLQEMAGNKLESEFVEVIAANPREVMAIREICSESSVTAH